MANLIEQIKIGGTTYNIASTAYAICDSNADATAKVADITGFVLKEGVTIHVKFTNGNTADTPTLNVNSTGAIPITIYGSVASDTAGDLALPANAVVSLTYVTDTANYWVMNSGHQVNTTYTFAGGTNKFTVTPSGGTAQEVTVTPSIANNITGSGTRTNNYLVKFSGQNTITNLVAISNAISSQTTSTKFLREDGTWATPSYTEQSHYTATLINGNAATDQSNEAVTASANGIYLNLVENGAVTSSHQLAGAGGITIGSAADGKITFTGKAGTVTKITPGNGLINGTSGTSQTGITGEGTISIKEGGVTNSMLAGSISNDKLSNDWIKIGNVTKHLGETFELSDLGVARAMNFIGITSTALTDGATTATLTAKTTGSLSKTTGFVLGDVVLYGDAEFVWTGSAWELLGDETAYALKSDAVTNVAYASKKFTKTINGSTTDIVAISTIKTDLALVKGDVGLDNVTNHQQVHEVSWDATNLKITRSKNGTAGDVVKFVNGTNVTLSGATAGQLSISAADPTVTQNILGTSDANNYPLLVSKYKTTENTTTASTTNRVAAIYVQPSTGTLTATKFAGDGSGLTALSATAVKSALGTDSSTTATFLRKDGTWKTISVKVTSNTSGSVVTGVTLNPGTQPSFTQGTLASATVNEAVLELVSQTADTFNKGTYPTLGTISKANLSIDMQ